MENLLALPPTPPTAAKLDTNCGLRLKDGTVLDFKNLPDDAGCTQDMIAACVFRITQLEGELAAARKLSSGQKRAGDEDVAAGPAGKKAKASGPASKAGGAAHKKKLAQALVQFVKQEKFRPGASHKTIKVSDVLDEDLVRQIFLDQPGTLVQPTPENNPKSGVFIKKFSGSEAISALGVSEVLCKGSLWNSRSSRNPFQKDKKNGSTDVALKELTMTWAKNSCKLRLAAEAKASVGSDFYGDSGDDSGGGW